MTDLEKEFLENSRNIYNKILAVEEAELEGITDINKEALTKEFIWQKTYNVIVFANPQHSLAGSISLGSLDEALDYKNNDATIYFSDVEWDGEAEDAFEEVSFENIEVYIDDFSLKNPSKDYLKMLEDNQAQRGRKVIVNTLTRCFKSSGLHPDEFHVIVDEVIDDNEEFKSSFNYGR